MKLVEALVLALRNLNGKVLESAEDDGIVTMRFKNFELKLDLRKEEKYEKYIV